MNIAVISSSRADYSIYLPLLKALTSEPGFSVEILAFGTHLSAQHGHTIDQIRADGFSVRPVDAVPVGDTPADVSRTMGATMRAFADVWTDQNYDLLLCLGDRYEMFAAVSSAVPFTLPIAHIHGGETTLGAIDNAFRHAITVMATYHFTTTEPYKQRVIELTGSDQHVYNVGALSIDNLSHLTLLTNAQFLDRFGIDLDQPTILITFHPETVSFQHTADHVTALLDALTQLDTYQLVITMPNADTMGNYVRAEMQTFIDAHTNAVGVESFGTIGYLSCMKACRFMLGNTSSGFVEASFFPKYVINLGDRQRGRILTPNIIDCPLDSAAILTAVRTIESAAPLSPINVYGDGTAAEQTVSILRNIRDELH